MPSVTGELVAWLRPIWFKGEKARRGAGTEVFIAGAHCWRGNGPDEPYGLCPGQYGGAYDGGRSDEVATAVDAGGSGLVPSPDGFEAGGVSKLPTLVPIGGAIPCCDGDLEVTPPRWWKLGGGSSKLGRVGAPGLRVFNDGGVVSASKVPVPDTGGGTARAARLADVSLTEASG